MRQGGRNEMKKTLAKAIKGMQVKSWEMRERSAGLVPGEALGQGSGYISSEGRVTLRRQRKPAAAHEVTLVSH